jgi:hypothetical protein
MSQPGRVDVRGLSAHVTIEKAQVPVGCDALMRENLSKFVTGLIFFVLIPGYMPLWPGLAGPVLWILG